MKNWDDMHPTYRSDLGRRLLPVVEKLPSKKVAAEIVGISAEQLSKWMRADGENQPKVPVDALLSLCLATGGDFY